MMFALSKSSAALPEGVRDLGYQPNNLSSLEGRQNWDQAEGARESMHESERRLTSFFYFFFLEKALLSGRENNYPFFMSSGMYKGHT